MPVNRKGRVTIKKLRPGAYDISIGGQAVDFAFTKKEAVMKANRIRKWKKKG